MRRLMSDEWQQKQHETFSYLRGRDSHWTRKHCVLVSQWLDDHPSPGWVFETQGIAVFERSVDALAFRIWMSSDPFGLDALRYRPRPVEEAMNLLDGF
jgi:hypothetical protein